MGYRQEKNRCYDLFMLRKWLVSKFDLKRKKKEVASQEMQQLREWAKLQIGQMAQLRGKLVL